MSHGDAKLHHKNRLESNSEIEKECINRDTTLEKYLALVGRMKNYLKGF
jgi:hypothetical protein